MLQNFVVKQFRNLSYFNLEITSKVSYIYGNNNCGKTSLLEALYLFLTGVFLNEKDIESLVQFDQEKAVLYGEWKVQGVNDQIYLTLDKHIGIQTVLNKQVVKNKKICQQKCIADYVSSDVNRFFQESPEQRRRVLDDFCMAYFPLFTKYMKQYSLVNRQKNSLLKSAKIDEVYRNILNEQLADASAHIISYRRKGLHLVFNYFIENQGTLFSDIFKDVSFHYFCHRLSLDHFDMDGYKEAFMKQVQLDMQKEQYLGYSLIGAKRDDFDVTIQGKSLFRYFSKGINRLFAILFKIAQWHLLSQHCEKPLTLLLDDAFAEIDQSKREQLAQYVSTYDQIFYTCTDKKDIDIFSDIRCVSIK